MSADVLTRPTAYPQARPVGAHRVQSHRRVASRDPNDVGYQPELPDGVVVALRALACLVVLLLWLVLYAVALSGLGEQHTQHQLYAKLRVELSNQTVAIGAPIRNGAPIAVLNAPKAGLHGAVVVEGTSSSDLQKGPGHWVTSVLPGQIGQSVLVGKSVTFGAPFGGITSLRKGDALTVTTGQGVAQYTVTDIRRAGDPLPQPLAGTEGRLTLVALAGNGWRSALAPNQTVFVDASLQGEGKPVPPGRPSAIPAGQRLMQGDTGALNDLVLWLEVLLVVGVAVVWLRTRWGGWQVWLVGTPVLLAALWIVTETSARLLPNLL
jgi:sortase A